jgi:homoserine kinase type II
MSVYTPITMDDLALLATEYGISPISFQGITAGVTNSIYQITTSEGNYCLTIFETLMPAEIQPYIELIDDLYAEQIPCARVRRTRDQQTLILLQHKPAVLVDFLPGATLTTVTPSQCSAVGKILARFHEAGQKSQATLVNTRDRDWHDRTAQKVFAYLTPPEQQLLTESLDVLHANPLSACPQGIIHFDLFRDNVLMIDDEVTGLLDFYYACHGPFILDIAVCINDWCRDEHGELSRDHYEALLAGYEEHRPLSALEQKQLPQALILAALRFWLSRLHDQLFPSSGSLVQIKNPAFFASILHSLLNQ